ncbi:efflux RND transporter permease subunit [Heyndrickxia acidicola]|uniref:Efflux RND transporter permease subunit n=1 Tax=Heyndrickxia acidicola TaxID=209389 RepID=A0ABU6MGL3_9BACI|nr:efflux RND transporter permease subunit [Heyndrickxia acidicola]MED1203817.1 efflux RND transporter permease subunit [Heyndrickxia acidicola]
MNAIINFCLKNKFAIWLITLIVTIAGIYAGINMKMETLPNINAPIITITTTYPGATPNQVAEDVTKPIEQQIKNLPGVDTVSSTSMQNASTIQIQYNYNKDMDKAQNEVKDALTSVNLPDNVKTPTVSRFNINDFPILSLSLSNKHQSLAELTQTATEDVIPDLEGIEGVSQVQASGQYVQEVDLTFNQDKLNKYGLSEDTIKQLIQGSDVSVPLGLINFGNKNKSVVIDGNIKSLDDFKNIEIPYTPKQTPSMGAAGGSQSSQAQGGMQSQSQASQSGQMTGRQGSQSQGAGAQYQSQSHAQSSTANTQAGSSQAANVNLPTVKLKDLANIVLVGKHESISKTNGQESIGIEITKSQDANTVDVANNINDEVSKLKKTHPGLTVSTILDQATPIKDSVQTMLTKAIIGAIFAVLIILIFLRNIRSTIISVISIPLSLLIGVLILKQMDISLNIMTLGAMTVAIGRVVDDSIVVIENIYRRMSDSNEPLRGKDLIREATKEMFRPIASSTIVTVAVFLPLGLVQGMVGQLFLPFALTLVFSLLASLVVAVTVVPMFADSLFKKEIKKKSQHEKEPAAGRLAGAYKKALNWSLNHKLITFGLAVLLLIGSFFLVPFIGVSFISNDQQKTVMATFNPNPGETQQDVETVASKADDYFLHRKGVQNIQYSIGKSPFGGNDQSAVFYAVYNKDAKNFDKEPDKVIKDLQSMTNKGTWKSQDFSSSGSSNQITVSVYGDDIDQIKPVVEKLENNMKDVKNLKNVDSSLSKTYQEYTLEADQSKLSKLGLTAGQIAMGLNQSGNNPALTTLKINGKDIDVYVQADKSSYTNVNDLTNTKIKTALGSEVPLNKVVTVKTGDTPDTISRQDGKMYASVTGTVGQGDVSKVSKDVQKAIDKTDIPKNVQVSMGGVTKDIKDSFTNLGLAMLAAVAIVYLILVITFGGALAPLAVLFSLPFAIIGGLVALWITHETLSVTSMIGALMLIGIVVTNAIVLIDRVIHKEREGFTTREALLEAGATRLRPILMTAIATIGALLPLAFGFEGGGLISKGMGVTVIGGLASSTLLTLLIVPVVYEFFMKFTRKSSRKES